PWSSSSVIGTFYFAAGSAEQRDLSLVNEDEPKLTPAAARQAAPSRPAPAPVSAAGAGELDERLTMVAARAGAVRASLDNLKQSQAQGGLGLRRDMATAENTMGFNLQQAEEKLAA